MMTSINSRKALRGLLLFSLLLGLLCLVSIMRSGDGVGEEPFDDDRQLEMQTFRAGDGWGYQILMKGKVFISQPVIPAIEETRPFPTEESAAAVGQMVLQRIRFRRDPALTPDDITRFINHKDE